MALSSSGTAPSKSSKPRQTPSRPPSAPSPDPLRVELFFERVLRHTKGRWAGKPFLLEPWQRHDIIRPLYGTLDPDGTRQYRSALIGVARKNGKSELSAGLALYHLTIGGEPGGEVYSLAASRAQASIVFNVARAMVEASPPLAARCRVFRSVIEDPVTGSIYRTLSKESRLAHGYNPNCAVIDELHVHADGELYEAMRTAMGARAEPMLISITTAGFDSDSFCYQLYDRAREGTDPRFFFRWWQAPDACALDDRAAWRQGNPASWITDEFLADQLVSPDLSENGFRRLHLNQWTEATEAWFPFGYWETLATDRRLQPGETVALALDGSFSGDSTALVACTPDEFLSVVGAWEKPPRDDTWRVDIADVEAAVLAACRTYNVVEVTADPYRWQRSLEVLAAEGIPVTEFPQSAQRMSPATSGFYDAAMDRRLSHDGDQRLARHIAHCVLKTDARGSRIVKDAKTSPRKIDLAVCSVMAHARAIVLRPSVESIYEERGLLTL